MLRLLCLLFAALTFLSVSQTEAATYYVDQDGLGGSCSNSNPGTLTQPRCTINAGVQLLSSGDTLYIRGATYLNQNIGQYGPTPVPNGTSWETATTIAAYPGETAVLQNGGIAMINGNAYIIFDRLIMKNGGLYLDASAHHIRFQNGEISAEQPGYNIVHGTATGVHHLEVLNSRIHGARACHTEAPPCQGAMLGAYYGIYWSGHSGIFDGNEIYDNAGYGIHLFHSGANDAANNIVSNNTIYGNGFDDGPRGLTTCAVILATGANNKACNNVVSGNTCGIQIDYRCNDCAVIANTVYENQGFGIAIGNESHRVVVRDNVTWQNGQEIVDNVGDALRINNRLGPVAGGERPQASAGECPKPSDRPPAVVLPAPRNLRAVRLPVTAFSLPAGPQQPPALPTSPTRPSPTAPFLPYAPLLAPGFTAGALALARPVPMLRGKRRGAPWRGNGP
jgi:parallel beta-helix repeat protein